MLRFKAYLRENYLAEATEKHFAHVPGFDPKNPEHMEMVDAFNRSGFPTNHSNKIKSIDELKDKVAPKLTQMRQSRALDKEHQEAIDRGDARLVHHDPEKGVKVFKVKNQRGGCAVGKGTKWCIADPQSQHDMVNQYDPEGGSSHVIHLDKEKGNLSRVGIIGVNYMKPHTDGVGGNFQDKGNVTVSDHDWNHLRKKYNLDSIPALHGIRGISPNQEDLDKKEHLDGLIRDNLVTEGGNGYRVRFDIPKEHLHRLVDSPFSSIRSQVAENSHLSKEHLDKLIGDKDDGIRRAVARHPNATKEHLDKLVGDKGDGIRRAVARNPNATKEHLDKLVGDKDDSIRRAVASNPNATKEHLDKLVGDKNDDVRYTVAHHPNLTKEHLDKLVGDKDDDVRRVVASKNPNLTKEHLDKLVGGGDIGIRYAVASNPHLSKEYLDKLVQDDSTDIRSAVVGHPNLTKEHLDNLAVDKDAYISDRAKSRLAAGDYKKPTNPYL